MEIADNIEEAVKNADLIQENVPERLSLKKDIIKNISKYARKNSIIASSSSGLLPSDLQSKCLFYPATDKREIKTKKTFLI